MLVKQWMTTEPLAVQAKDSLMHARVLMKRHTIRHLPVLSGDRIVGVLSDRDLRDYTPSHCSSLDVFELHYLIAKLTVDDAMTPRPVTVGPDETVTRAGELMLKKRIGCLPVEEGGRLVGILTESDLVRALVAAENQVPFEQAASLAGPEVSQSDAEC